MSGTKKKGCRLLASGDWPLADRQQKVEHTDNSFAFLALQRDLSFSGLVCNLEALMCCFAA